MVAPFTNGSTVAIEATLAAATVPHTATAVPCCLEVKQNTSLLPYVNSSGSNLIVTDNSGNILPFVRGIARIAERGACSWSIANMGNAVASGNLRIIGYGSQVGLDNNDWRVGAWNVATNTWTSTKLGDQPGNQEDDHNNPCVCVGSDGTICLFAAEHNTAVMRLFKSTAPNDISAFMEINHDTLSSSAVKAYAHCFNLRSVGTTPSTDVTVLMYRINNANPRPRIMAISVDGGMTFGFVSTLISSATHRPYPCCVWDEANERLHVFWSPGAYGEVANNLGDILHAYVDFSAFDGSTIGSIKLRTSNGNLVVPGDPVASGFGTATLSEANGTLVDDATDRGFYMWPMDAAVDSSGNPVVLHSEIRSNYDLRVRYARWSGSSWTSKELLAEGQTIQRYDPTQIGGYAHGMTLLNADTVFCTGEDSTGRMNLYKFTTINAGTSFTQTTELVPAQGIYRVIAFRGASTGDSCQLAYMHGFYTNDTWTAAVPQNICDIGLWPYAGSELDLNLVTQINTNSAVANVMWIQTGGAIYTPVAPFSDALYSLHGELRGYRVAATNAAYKGLAALTGLFRFKLRADNALNKYLFGDTTASADRVFTARLLNTDVPAALWIATGGALTHNSTLTVADNTVRSAIAMRWDSALANESAICYNGSALHENGTVAGALASPVGSVASFAGVNENAANQFLDGNLFDVIIYPLTKTNAWLQASTITMRGDLHTLGSLEVAPAVEGGVVTSDNRLNLGFQFGF